MDSSSPATLLVIKMTPLMFNKLGCITQFVQLRYFMGRLGVVNPGIWVIWVESGSQIPLEFVLFKYLFSFHNSYYNRYSNNLINF